MVKGKIAEMYVFDGVMDFVHGGGFWQRFIVFGKVWAPMDYGGFAAGDDSDLSERPNDQPIKEIGEIEVPDDLVKLIENYIGAKRQVEPRVKDLWKQVKSMKTKGGQ